MSLDEIVAGAGEAQLGGELTAPHVRMRDDEARELARRLWSLQVDAERLDTEKDDTFRLQTDTGSRYVLKVSNPSEDPSEVDFECGAIEHAQRAGAGVPVPRLLPAGDGGIVVPIEDAAGQRRLARVMTYLDGVPLEATASSADQRERIGETLATLRLALADYAHPADRRRCAWDISGLPALAPLLDVLDERADRLALLRAAFERYVEHVAPRVPRLRRQVVHNDFNRSNVLVDPARPDVVTGVIDFGDVVRTAIAIDVSTALMNQLPRDAAERPVDDLFADARDVLRGYLRRADLTEEELRLLPHLALGRVVARAIITLHRARRMPENRRYILRYTEPGWGQLAWLLDRSPSDLESTFA